MSDLAAEAKALLNNEAFVAALETARRQAIAAAMGCAVSDDDGRRRYLDAARTVDRLAGHLNALVVSAKSGEEVDPSQFYEDQARRRWSFFAARP